MSTFDGPSWALSKRPRADSDDSSAPLQYQHYRIGWICALPIEMSAAEAMLDRTHDPLPRRGSDTNTYTLGSIGAHNVVIACLPKGHYGTNNAASVARNMVCTFENIKHGLLVGIGGAIPGPVDVRLGDVVVSTEVIQYDLGKAMPNGHFQRTGYPTRPPQPLLTAVSKLQASHDRGSSQISHVLNDIAQRSPEMVEFARPRLRDRLFRSHYLHALSADSCDECDQSQLVNRKSRETFDPKIHHGRIASGNQVIKDAKTRDQLAQELDSICFEMEAAGVMDNFPSLVIRGICDYSDSHKNKQWQKYAAAVAAAYAKELLLVLPAPMIDITDFDMPDRDADACLQALFIADPSRDRDDIIDAKGDICQGTCEWILSTDEFRTWSQSAPHLLWISAPPGKGKTYMSIYLSQYFEQVARERSNEETVFFFCDNKHETRNTAINILRGLIYQLVLRQHDLIYILLPQWKTQSSGVFKEQSFNTLWKVFENMIAKLEASVVYCVIDGLDECEQTSLLTLLRKFELLSKKAATLSAKTKLVCLSRRYPERIPEALHAFQKLDLDVAAAAKDDVKLFISRRVLDLSEKKNLPRKLRDKIEKTFQQQSEDTFLWVSYMAQYLERKNLWEIEASLKELPQGLDAVYERILSHIDLRNQDTILRMLGWILVVTRPLRIPELCEAVQIQPTEFLSREDICLAFIRSCGHFLQVTLGGLNGWIPGGAGTNGPRREVDYEGEPEFKLWQLEVTFVHQSAKDYLVKSRQMTELESHSCPTQQLNEYVAGHLIGYLSNPGLQLRFSNLHIDEDSGLPDILVEYPLANYAIHCWHHHFRDLDEIHQIIWQNEEFFAIHSKIRWNSCCFFGHEKIVFLLLDAGANAAIRDQRGRTPFTFAVRRFGRDLLRRLVTATEKRHAGWIKKKPHGVHDDVLREAAWAGNEEASRYLVEELEWDMNRGNAVTNAVMGGHLKLARIFVLEWNTRFDYVDIWNAASYSPLNHFQQTIEMLLEDFSVDINAKDRRGCNILCTILRSRSYNINERDMENGYYKVKAMLQRGCDPRNLNNMGQTPLHCAANFCYAGAT
ncbi:hypothetical protein FSARC_4562 [Fusarium sarcochroum]|uniref:Nucleoside phosphorylase domain-containing protein n=1 Tax=Fusarium sarcochroum TaxID=1208366 RepID=A0A8H4U1A8_9HYPO|nr:hypothetical protein FSARC_4562 [Fusarium sarcochroum]